MPVTQTAKKEVRKNIKKRRVNKKFADDMRISIRLFEKKIEKGEKLVKEDLANVYKKVDKAKKKNILHKNTAARKKSLLAKKFNKATAS